MLNVTVVTAKPWAATWARSEVPWHCCFWGIIHRKKSGKWMHASTEFPISRSIESWNLKTLRQDWRSIYASLWATWCCSSLHVQLCRMSFKMCLNITFLPDCSGRLPSVSFLHVFVCWGQAGDTQYLDNSSQTWNRAILGWLRIIIPVTSHRNCSGQYSISNVAIIPVAPIFVININPLHQTKQCHCWYFGDPSEEIEYRGYELYVSNNIYYHIYIYLFIYFCCRHAEALAAARLQIRPHGTPPAKHGWARVKKLAGDLYIGIQGKIPQRMPIGRQWATKGRGGTLWAPLS